MNNQSKLRWLRRVLLAKVLVTFLFWGLPSLLAPEPVFDIFGMQMPDDPTFLRLFGALVIAFGFAYCFAYQDPVKNVAILQVGIIDNGLATLTIFALGLTVGISSWFLWVSAALTGFFCVAFAILMPREEVIQTAAR